MVENDLASSVEVWMNDLVWARINTLIARKRAGMSGGDTIKTACTLVTIPPGDRRRKLPPVQVLRRMGYSDIAAKLEREMSKEDGYGT